MNAIQMCSICCSRNGSFVEIEDEQIPEKKTCRECDSLVLELPLRYIADIWIAMTLINPHAMFINVISADQYSQQLKAERNAERGRLN